MESLEPYTGPSRVKPPRIEDAAEPYTGPSRVKPGSSSPEGTTGEFDLVPADYDLPDKIRDRLDTVRPGHRIEATDPTGLLHSGLLMHSTEDPEHRRLILGFDSESDGSKPIVRIHVEGSDAYWTKSPEVIRAKLEAGELSVIPRPE